MLDTIINGERKGNVAEQKLKIPLVKGISRKTDNNFHYSKIIKFIMKLFSSLFIYTEILLLDI